MFAKLYLTAAVIVVFGWLGCMLVDGFGDERWRKVATRIGERLNKAGVVLLTIFVLECIEYIWVVL